MEATSFLCTNLEDLASPQNRGGEEEPFGANAF
jgi:hypothetical protein